MPVHNWKGIEDGLFHHLHHAWVDTLAESLNEGVLPKSHLALMELSAGDIGPDVLTLQLADPGPRVSNSRAHTWRWRGDYAASQSSDNGSQPKFEFHEATKPYCNLSFIQSQARRGDRNCFARKQGEPSAEQALFTKLKRVSKTTFILPSPMYSRSADWRRTESMLRCGSCAAKNLSA